VKCVGIHVECQDFTTNPSHSSPNPTPKTHPTQSSGEESPPPAMYDDDAARQALTVEAVSRLTMMGGSKSPTRPEHKRRIHRDDFRNTPWEGTYFERQYWQQDFRGTDTDRSEVSVHSKVGIASRCLWRLLETILAAMAAIAGCGGYWRLLEAIGGGYGGYWWHCTIFHFHWQLCGGYWRLPCIN
jgi:hypothetical protein